jgi:low temperature requirement protein LtrA
VGAPLVVQEGPVNESELRVTWAELFFDLVFVFALTEVSALLHADQSWTGVLRAVVVFVPIYWAWVGTSVHANTHGVETPFDRLGVFAIGLGGLFMALAVPDAYGQRGVLFGAAYYALRVVLAVLAFRARRMNRIPFTVPVLVSGPLLLAGGFASGTTREVLWGVAGLIDLATPTLARRRLSAVRFAPTHLAERFGGFLIIALGESIVAIGVPAASARHLGGHVVVAVGVAFALACALWWVYFVFAASAVRHALATARVKTDIVRQVLSYGHLSFMGSIIAVAVGSTEVIASPERRLDGAAAGLLFGGCALYLATFGYTRWAMFRQVSTTRLGAAAVILAVLPAAAWLSALADLVLLAVVVIALNVLEHVRFRRAEHAQAAAGS